jgi:hypothetical protein
MTRRTYQETFDRATAEAGCRRSYPARTALDNARTASGTQPGPDTPRSALQEPEPHHAEPALMPAENMDEAAQRIRELADQHSDFAAT